MNAAAPGAAARPRVRRRFVDCPDGQIHVRSIDGVGEPLVLFHASPGSARMLEPLMLRLAGGRPLYALDTLGNGDSSPAAVADPDIAYFAAAARRAMDALDIGRCALYGTHTGAHLAVELAVAEPDRYSAIVIDGMGLYSSREAEEFERRYLPHVRPADDGSQVWWAWHFVRSGYLFFPWFETDEAHRTAGSLPPADYLHAKVIEVLKALETYRFSYRAAFRYPKRQMLARLTVPALVTLGSQDVLARYFDDLVAAVPGAQSALIEASGFDGHVERLAHRIDAFLSAGPHH